MATSYSTPGVYVVEKSLFPPSVAQVETAVPAFVGYTEKAMDKTANDLILKPTKVESLLEYERYFGRGPEKDVTSVDLAADNTVATVVIPQVYFTYDSVRLFYENGGGKCYIVSIDTYNPAGAMNRADFEDGIDTLLKKDEPTMILFPDATSLTTETDLYELQKRTLKQCADLMDRVGVFDTYYREEDKAQFDLSIDTLRTNIGVNNLKYGAVYTPWLKSGLPRNYNYADIYNKLFKLGLPIKLSSLTVSTNVQIKNLLDDYDRLLDDRVRILTQMETYLAVPLTGDPNMLDDRNREILEGYETDLNNFKTQASAGNLVNARARFADLMTNAFSLLARIDAIGNIAVVTTPDLNADIQSRLTALAASTEFTNLILLKNIISIGANAAKYIGMAGPAKPAGIGNVDVAAGVAVVLALPDIMFPFNSAHPAFIPGFNNAQFIENLVTVETVVTKGFLAFYNLLQDVLNSLGEALATKENSLYSSFQLYKNIIDYINKELTLLPPSGAIAGIYAYVDATRGVWKAPANVSLSMVRSVSLELTDKNQESLNIDVNSGKSINVIRPFTGKGILVWGARTLAGNDNEWRYVPVRRFFNMVEESVKKSTFWAVFEPNDANTWSKVKGMIDNFLTLQWRNGALQGAKPDDAFYVKIGLGQTMTAQDILEGRMNVEIGMAVVRPAEFIILTFTHLMATSS